MIMSLIEERLLDLKIPCLGADKILATKLDGEDYLSYPFCFEITFLSDNLSLTGKDVITKPVSITIGDHSDNPQKYNGLIYALSGGKINTDGFKSYKIIVTPWLRFLDAIEDSQIYCVKAPKSIPEIVTQIFKKYNYLDYDVSKLKQKYPKLNYCVQYKESMFNFVTRLLETVGIYYYFTHNGNKHTMVLEDNGNFVNDAKPVKYNQAGMDQAHIYKWSKVVRVIPGNIKITSYDFRDPKNLLIATCENKTLPAECSKLQTHQHGNTRPEITQQELDTQARNWVQTNITKSKKIKAQSNYHQFCAGTVFNISEHAIKSEIGKYYIYAIRHQVKDKTGLMSHEQQENAQEYSNQFRAYLSQNRFTPLARYNELAVDDFKLEEPLTPKKHALMQMLKIIKPNIDYPHSAVVTGPKGKEIYTDKYGRVKVKFHWDRHSDQDENSSCWIRVAQLFAGDGYGSSFIPRIGEEVIVKYEHGNPDKPIITGVMPNAKTKMPYDPEENPLQTGIRSHSFGSDDPEDGNEIRFEDKPGSEEIHIKAQKDLTVQVDGNSEQNFGEDVFLTINEGDYNMTVGDILEVKAKDRIAMSCGTSEIIITDTDIIIQADSIDLKQGEINIPVASNLTGTALLQETAAKLNAAGATVAAETKAKDPDSEPDQDQTYWIKTSYLNPDHDLEITPSSFTLTAADPNSGSFSNAAGSVTLSKTEQLKQLTIDNIEIVQIAGEKIPYPSNIATIKTADFKAVTSADLPHEKPKPADKILTAEALYPPMIINLRGANPQTQLTPSQIQYIKNHGNNITIFIHGYNVPLGGYPNHFTDIKKKPMLPGSIYVTQNSDTNCTIYRNMDMLKQNYPDLNGIDMISQDNSGLNEDCINGTYAHNWFVHMEDNLNKATGQFDRSDYSKYTRLLHVTWEGDVGEVDFPGAEDSADKAGPMFAQTIQQLSDAGIKINVIAHSLGNRVLLKAMDKLGEAGKNDIIEHVFLWQAAVPQTALSNDLSKDTTIRKNGHFVNAYKAANKITVLYSKNDQVLSLAYWFGNHLDEVEFVDKHFNTHLTSSGTELEMRFPKNYNVIPASGHNGPDKSTIQLLDKKLISASCSEWIKSHSAMRDPDPASGIMENVYKRYIIKGESGMQKFGLYF